MWETLFSPRNPLNRGNIFKGRGGRSWHRIPKKEGFLVAMAPESARMPSASSVAILAQENYEPGDLYDYFGMEPFYIRRSEAEELWEKRHPSK